VPRTAELIANHSTNGTPRTFRSFYAVLLLNYSISQRVTVNKKPVQCSPEPSSWIYWGRFTARKYRERRTGGQFADKREEIEDASSLPPTTNAGNGGRRLEVGGKSLQLSLKQVAPPLPQTF